MVKIALNLELNTTGLKAQPSWYAHFIEAIRVIKAKMIVARFSIYARHLDCSFDYLKTLSVNMRTSPEPINRYAIF